MDKELIERIAQSVINDATSDRINFEFCTDDLVEFLARIDAERGEGAIGYVEKHMIERIKEFGFAHVEVSTINRSSSRVPIFTSPTIPEGMALVKKAVLRDRGFVYMPGNVSGAAIPIVTVQFDLNDWDSRDAFAGEMIAAAQGEK